MLIQSRKPCVNPLWLLLNSELTIHLIKNHKLVENIRKAPGGKYIAVWCNVRICKVDMVTYIGSLRKLWFDKESSMDILSLTKVTDKYRLMFDSESGNYFSVHKGSHQVNFCQNEKGLYYHDVRGDRDATLMNIVKENMEGFTHQEIKHME